MMFCAVVGSPVLLWVVDLLRVLLILYLGLVTGCFLILVYTGRCRSAVLGLLWMGSIGFYFSDGPFDLAMLVEVGCVVGTFFLLLLIGLPHF